MTQNTAWVLFKNKNYLIQKEINQYAFEYNERENNWIRLIRFLGQKTKMRVINHRNTELNFKKPLQYMLQHEKNIKFCTEEGQDNLY